ncbi:MAG TPA: hypothetical protein VH083_02280 [Myxococcales bacterium]|jgi:hypothetical protein|nr:hypothetical protein [Myxococcales bacterium]
MAPQAHVKHSHRSPADEYFWEKDREESVRQNDEAEQSVETMLRRIEMSAADQEALKADAGQFKHLVAYGLEVHLNIAWYLRKMKEGESQRRTLVTLIILLGIGGLCAIPIFWKLADLGSGSNWNVIFFQLTAFPAAGFGILRVLATVTDTRCRLGNFWRARSDLSEILYLFEHKWQGQFSTERAASFWKDIDDGITSARQITRDERQKFFDSMQSPTDVLTVAQQALDGVTNRFQVASIPVQAVPPPDPPAVARPPGG